MKASISQPILPGSKVRVEQKIVVRDNEHSTTTEGEVLSHQLEPTGSWFTRGNEGRFWLARLRLKRADGEITTLNLDRHSKITILSTTP